MNKTPKIRLATLNARSFLGGSNSKNQQKQTLLSKHLRSQDYKLDNLCLQGITATLRFQQITDSHLSKVHHHFPNTSPIVSKYAAIINLNSRYELINSCISIDGRCIITSEIDRHCTSGICTLVNICAPAGPKERPIFYKNLLILINCSSFARQDMIILGDSNLHLNKRQTSMDRLHWQQLLRKEFIDCHEHMNKSLPTYQSGNHRTTIDYMFAHATTKRCIQDTKIEFHSSPTHGQTTPCLLWIWSFSNPHPLGLAHGV